MLLLSIQILGCKYIDEDENVETGVPLRSGKYEESMPVEVDDKVIQNVNIEEMKILNGEWQIDRAVLESTMYTGTSLDGDFGENIVARMILWDIL